MPPVRKARKLLWGLFIATISLIIIRPFAVNPFFSVFLPVEILSSQATYNDRSDGKHTVGRYAYAYVFYASNDAYACSALVNVARLLRTLPEDVDLVMIAFDSVSLLIRDVAAQRLGVLVYNTSSFGEEYNMGSPIGGDKGKYRHCFLKFLAFLLPNTYRRPIVLDSDSLVLWAPNHLFHLPDELPLAIPSAYWLRPHFVSVTNWLMSVSVQQKRTGWEGRNNIYIVLIRHFVFSGTPIQGDISHIAKRTLRELQAEVR
jgi:alpha-N-acetylglucosamine transferase